MPARVPVAVHVFPLRGDSILLLRRANAPPADTIPYVRAAIANYRSGRWFEEFGWGAEKLPEETR